jgi:hypothetical protein
MSVVTNLVMSVSFEDARGSGSKMSEVNSFFQSPIKGLTSVDDPSLPRGWYGGSKMLEANLFVGAFNHLSLEQFTNHLRGIKWTRPECVQLFVMEQEDERFRLINIVDEMPPLIEAGHA